MGNSAEKNSDFQRMAEFDLIFCELDLKLAKKNSESLKNLELPISTSHQKFRPLKKIGLCHACDTLPEIFEVSRDSGLCYNICGNGYLYDPGEHDKQECDDGNKVGGDGCSADCIIEGGENFFERL